MGATSDSPSIDSGMAIMTAEPSTPARHGLAWRLASTAGDGRRLHQVGSMADRRDRSRWVPDAGTDTPGQCEPGEACVAKQSRNHGVTRLRFRSHAPN